MKQLIILFLFIVPFFGMSQPFAPSGKYGKLCTKKSSYAFSKRDYSKAFPFAPSKKQAGTKKNKRVNHKQAWIYRNWGR